MGGRLEERSSLSASSSKRRRRRRRDDDYAKPMTRRPRRRKQHLYLALDDWNGGYSIHKLDVDDILEQEPGGEHKLPEPAAVRIASPVRGPMAFAALGTNMFISTNSRSYGERAPPTLVYDTETSALAAGPRVPDNLCDLGDAMAVGEALYALTTVPYPEYSSLHALSWAPTAIPDHEPWDPAMEWSWNTVPLPLPLPYKGIDIITYALHPDGRTIFMSTGFSSYSFDTSSNGVGVWKELGDWVLPFRGPAFFDAELDAWVGLHRMYSGYVCCCPVASRSTTATRPPECRMLMEKLFRRKEEDPKHWPLLRGKETSLIYMGNSRFALFENILHSEHVNHGSLLHITLFGLKYDHKGELRTKVQRATRSYEVSKNTPMFSHAAFWM
ncbi:unnamed protein product [Urochloa decumbens]|uniref:Uncharacterized protein n=1 Tax=Urochloa decumbens TaxID=240449 RepID=A0ABC9F7T9_9POAL